MNITSKTLVTIPLIALCAGAMTETTAAKRPNVILIMADDLGWGDVGYNGHPIIKTPNIDAMAAQGVQFNRFYSASAVSSPTRASVLTGRNPYRTGVFNANVGILRPEEITLTELLKEEGYSTGHFGKWHLGSLTDKERDANRGKVGDSKTLNPPSEHGYDVAFVTEAKVPTWDPMKKPVSKNGEKVTNKGWRALKEGDEFIAYGTHYWDIDGNKVTDNLDGDDSRVIMDRAIPFIEQQIDDDKNFCAVIWFHAPHLPCVAGPEYAAMYSDQPLDMQNFAGCITAMDEQIGRLRAMLKERGVDKDTMIWFCSDNGPERGVGITAGLRERKRSLYEGGVRVPGILVWDHGIKKHFKTDFPAVTTDYLPTIAAVVGVDESKLKNEIDGINLMPMLQGKESERTKPIVMALKDQATITIGDSKVYSNRSSGVVERYNIAADMYEKSPQNITKEDAQYQNMTSILDSFKNSFEGGEYGTASVTRMEQKWVSPLTFQPQKKQAK